MGRIVIGLMAAVLFCLGGQLLRQSMADEPLKPKVKFASPDPFQTAPGAAGNAAPKETENPEVVRTTSGQPVPVIAVIEMREVYRLSRGYRAELEKLRNKSQEPSLDLKKLEAELSALEVLLHDSALNPSGQFETNLARSFAVRRSELPFDEALERVKASPSPEVQRLLKNYTIKQHELRGLREAEQLEQQAQRAALERGYLQKIRAIVHKIAHANNITHVINMRDELDKADGLQATIDSPIVFTDPGYNITSLVVTKLNDDYENEQTKAYEKRAESEKRPVLPDAEPAKK